MSESVCLSNVPSALGCLESPKAAICGVPICGDGTLCGGAPYTVEAVCAASDLAPQPAPPTLTLQTLECL